MLTFKQYTNNYYNDALITVHFTNYEGYNCKITHSLSWWKYYDEMYRVFNGMFVKKSKKIDGVIHIWFKSIYKVNKNYRDFGLKYAED